MSILWFNLFKSWSEHKREGKEDGEGLGKGTEYETGRSLYAYMGGGGRERKAAIDVLVKGGHLEGRG